MSADASSSAQLLRLPPIDRSQQVIEALSSYIKSADLKSGDRLPAERELMAALAVGRSTIREVISHFQALGVIELSIRTIEPRAARLEVVLPLPGHHSERQPGDGVRQRPAGDSGRRQRSRRQDRACRHHRGER